MINLFFFQHFNLFTYIQPFKASLYFLDTSIQLAISKKLLHPKAHQA